MKTKPQALTVEAYNPCKFSTRVLTNLLDKKPTGLAAANQKTLDNVFNSWMEEFEDKISVQEKSPEGEYYYIGDDILLQYGFQQNELDTLLDIEIPPSPTDSEPITQQIAQAVQNHYSTSHPEDKRKARLKKSQKCVEHSRNQKKQRA